MQSEGKKPVDTSEVPKGSGTGALWCLKSLDKVEVKNER